MVMRSPFRLYSSSTTRSFSILACGAASLDSSRLMSADTVRGSPGHHVRHGLVDVRFEGAGPGSSGSPRAFLFFTTGRTPELRYLLISSRAPAPSAPRDGDGDPRSCRFPDFFTLPIKDLAPDGHVSGDDTRFPLLGHADRRPGLGHPFHGGADQGKLMGILFVRMVTCSTSLGMIPGPRGMMRRSVEGRPPSLSSPAESTSTA